MYHNGARQTSSAKADPFLDQAAATRLSGVHVPVRHHPHGPLHIDNRCYNQLITALRASTERGNALLGR